MADRDPAQRRRAAETVAQADSDGYAVYVARLLRPVGGTTETIQKLVHGIWGQYPNPDYPRGPGKDPPMWFARPEPKPDPSVPRSKRPRPHDPENVDWLKGLAALELDSDELTRDLPRADTEAVRADMLLRVALLRAVAAAGKLGQRDAVYPIFQFAFVRDGLFRDECGRTLRSMGSFAVPALIRIYNNRTKSNFKMRRYASYQLDRMDRLRPTKAIATAPDDVVRADIVHAYGEVLALDAVEAVLEQVNSNSHRVRREARWAWLRYVDGPPPPPTPKRKRKLPGGKEETEEKEDYLDYREMAMLALGRTFQALFNEEPNEGANEKQTARQLTDRLFAYYDRQREQEFAQIWDSGRAAEQRGDFTKAVAEYSWILANQPDHPRRSEMAMAFRRLGEQLADSGERQQRPDEIGRALGFLRQALALDPAMADAKVLWARVHFLDGEQAVRQGSDGRGDFEQAVAADPTLEPAQKALRRAAPARYAIGVGHWLMFGIGLLVLALAYLLWRLSPRS